MPKKKILDKKPAIVEISKKGLGEGRLARAAIDPIAAGPRIIKRVATKGVSAAADEQLEALDAGLDVVTNPTLLIPKNTRTKISKVSSTARKVERKSKAAARSVKKTSKKLKL